MGGVLRPTGRPSPSCLVLTHWRHLSGPKTAPASAGASLLQSCHLSSFLNFPLFTQEIELKHPIRIILADAFDRAAYSVFVSYEGHGHYVQSPPSAGTAGAIGAAGSAEVC